MNALELYKIQIEYYNGDEKKAFHSLSIENRNLAIPLYLKSKVKNKYNKRTYFNDVKNASEKNARSFGMNSKRGQEYHLDHIVPIFYGYKNHIPVSLISSIENLRIIPAKENIEKSAYLTEDSVQLLKKWGYYNKNKVIAFNNFIFEFLENKDKSKSF